MMAWLARDLLQQSERQPLMGPTLESSRRCLQWPHTGQSLASRPQVHLALPPALAGHARDLAASQHLGVRREEIFEQRAAAMAVASDIDELGLQHSRRGCPSVAVFGGGLEPAAYGIFRAKARVSGARSSMRPSATLPCLSGNVGWLGLKAPGLAGNEGRMSSSADGRAGEPQRSAPLISTLFFVAPLATAVAPRLAPFFLPIIGLVLIVAALRQRVAWRELIQPNAALIALGAVALYAALSATWAADPGEAATKGAVLLGIAFLVFAATAALATLNERQVRRASIAFLAVSRSPRFSSPSNCSPTAPSRARR